MMKHLILILCCMLAPLVFSQEKLGDTLRTSPQTPQQVEQDIQTLNKASQKPNNPKRAGLYSAILPGWGQYYNRKYWKIPIAWGGIGTGVGITLWNQKQYKRYRSAFLAELNGETHEFSDIKGITKEALGRTQDKFKRQRDYAIAITSLVYILNIVDAVVDAHLYDQKHDPDLAIKPAILYDEHAKQSTKAGLSLSFRF